MNKTKIETFDYTWNPVTGCLNACPYCYAQAIHDRFHGGDFKPKFHEERLKEPFKKNNLYRSNIFVCSMADLFGEWVPKEWILKVMDVVSKDRYNDYFFLTKNPKRYGDFFKYSNCYFGFSASDQKTYNQRSSESIESCVEIDFISFEPIQGKIDIYDSGYNFKWAIIGQETGGRKEAIKVKAEWVMNLIDQCSSEGIKVWLKENIIKSFVPEHRLQEHIIEDWKKA